MCGLGHIHNGWTGDSEAFVMVCGLRHVHSVLMTVRSLQW